MNLQQRIVLAVGFILVALSFIVPWTKVSQTHTIYKEVPIGLHHLREIDYTFTMSTYELLLFDSDRPNKDILWSWVALQVLALGVLTASGYAVAGHWVSGHWVKTPPPGHWVAGYWANKPPLEHWDPLTAQWVKTPPAGGEGSAGASNVVRQVTPEQVAEGQDMLRNVDKLWLEKRKPKE